MVSPSLPSRPRRLGGVVGRAAPLLSLRSGKGLGRVCGPCAGLVARATPHTPTPVAVGALALLRNVKIASSDGHPLAPSHSARRKNTSSSNPRGPPPSPNALSVLSHWVIVTTASNRQRQDPRGLVSDLRWSLSWEPATPESKLCLPISGFPPSSGVDTFAHAMRRSLVGFLGRDVLMLEASMGLPKVLMNKRFNSQVRLKIKCILHSAY